MDMKTGATSMTYLKLVNKRRIFALTLTVILLLSVMVGCVSKQDEPPAPDESRETDGGSYPAIPEDTDPAGEEVVIASDGKTDFTIWVANDIYEGYSDVIQQVTRVASLIKSKTGAKIDVKSDSAYSLKASKRAGILIGKTRFAESMSLGSKMKDKDYYVGLSGNKIVIYGGDINGISKAIRYFYITVLNSQKTENKTLVFNTAEHTMHSKEEYPIDSITCAGVELSQFTIVIPDRATVNESHFAYSLRYWLYQKYGCRISLVKDTTAESKNEILIGNTNRATAATLGKNEYSVNASDGKLCLTADGMISYNGMYDYLTTELLKPGNAADHVIDNGYSRKTVPPLGIDDGSSLVNKTADSVRMMSYNVFSNIVTYEDGTTTGPIDYRQSLQAEMIKAYAPDVVGMQEFTSNYASFASVMTGLGYTRASGHSQNPLFYNSETLTLVDSGYISYTGTDPQKGASWAVFSVKSTGKSFIAVSTHFMWNDPSLTEEQANAARLQNAAELLSLISDLRAEGYSELPVVSGGDYNCKLTSTALQELSDAGYDCAYDSATLKNNTDGYHSYSRYDAEFETYTIVYSPNKTHTDAIDHLFVSSGIDVKSFASLTVDYALFASDHCPIVMDFAIN